MFLGKMGHTTGTCRSGQGWAGKLASWFLRSVDGTDALPILGHASPLFVSHARRARGPTRAATDSGERPSPAPWGWRRGGEGSSLSVQGQMPVEDPGGLGTFEMHWGCGRAFLPIRDGWSDPSD